MSKRADIWMPFYVADYLSDTMHLTTEQHGAYLLLLLHYWKQGKPIPNNEEQLAAITKLSVERLRMHMHILMHFFCIADACLVHNRVEEEIQRAREISDTKTAASNKRWGKSAKRDAHGSSHAYAHGYASAKQVDMHMDVQSQSPNSDCDTASPSPKKKKRKAESIEELRDFCKSLSIPESDIVYLWNHWEDNGWKRNNRPIKDYRLAVRAWQSAGHLPSQKQRGRPVGPVAPIMPQAPKSSERSNIDHDAERLSKMKFVEMTIPPDSSSDQ